MTASLESTDSPLSRLIHTFFEIEKELDRSLAECAQLKSDLTRLRLENIELRNEIRSLTNMDDGY